MLDRSSIMVSMNKLTTEKRCAVVRALVEGCSIRATVRMTGVAKNTVVKLLVDLGKVCADYQDKPAEPELQAAPIRRDLVFVYAKAKNVPKDKQGNSAMATFGRGRRSTLRQSWSQAGWSDRVTGSAREFVNDLASRLAHRVQITTDGHKAYLEAVEGAFGWDVDYAMLVKIYGGNGGQPETRYSPVECVGCNKHRITGNPDTAHISTSYAECANLTMRMQMRRFTRLTNAFSKKLENHGCAVALHFMWYNFGRIHMSLRCTPAMRAGVTDHVWSIEEIVGLLDFAEKSSN